MIAINSANILKALSIPALWSNIWPILVAILVFLIMIAIHEFGHFIAARLVGVKVNEFAIGFGPKIWSKQGKETKYALRAFPVGGFCALEGEEESSGDPRAFCNQKPWKRLVIIVAGAFFNLLLGLIIVMIITSFSNIYATTTVSRFTDEAVSSSYGLKQGDEIIRVDGRRIFTTYDLSYAFTGVDDGTLDIVVKRGGEKVTLNDVKFQIETEDNISYVKVDFYVNGVERTFQSFISQSFKTTVSYARIVWFSLIDLVTGKYNISTVSGPVGVTVAISEAAKYGVADLLSIIALITINLGIFNLLPVPALDGSRAMFILIELIFRKPVKQKYETLIHSVGLIILLLFAVIISFKDIYQLFV